MMPADAHWEALKSAVFAQVDALGGADHLRGLAEEYVKTMRSGTRLRELAEQQPFTTLASGRIVAHPGWEAADRDLRRGLALAKALGLNKPGKVTNPAFAELDGAAPTSLAERRKRRAERPLP